MLASIITRRAKSDGGNGNTEINFVFPTGDEAGTSINRCIRYKRNQV